MLFIVRLFGGYLLVCLLFGCCLLFGGFVYCLLFIVWLKRVCLGVVKEGGLFIVLGGC